MRKRPVLEADDLAGMTSISSKALHQLSSSKHMQYYVTEAAILSSYHVMRASKLG